MKKVRRLLIVPARSGSKRIKNKNIKVFYGRPIIYYPLILAKKSKLFSKIHVSTDSKKIKSIVQKINIKIDFLRNKKLSKDKTDLYSVIKFVQKKFNKLGFFFEEIWCILPCSPLLDLKDLQNCSKIMKRSKYPLISVSPYSAPLNWALKIENGFLRHSENIRKEKDKKNKNFYDSGQIYCFTKKFLDTNRTFNFKKKIIPYILPLTKSVDVDTLDDWSLMKKLYRKRDDRN